MQKPRLAVRVLPSQLERAAALLPKIRKRAAAYEERFGELNAADLWRTVISRGLDALEKEAKGVGRDWKP